MNAITMLRMSNQIQGRVFPQRIANKMAKLFLTPRNPPLKEWERELEKSCKRVRFAGELTAAIWGNGDDKVLLVHGWESRATHMYKLVESLVKNGFQVVALDAPRHGQSGGEKANLVAFAEAILAVEVELGPFVAAAGHSLGGAALTYAMELGTQINCCALISSPACILDVLTGFARFMGLPAKAQQLFISYIERETGVPVSELDMGQILARKKVKTLLVHSQDDTEIPVQALNKIHSAWPESEICIVENLGHRKIIRDSDVVELVQLFVQSHHSPKVS